MRSAAFFAALTAIANWITIEQGLDIPAFACDLERCNRKGKGPCPKILAGSAVLVGDFNNWDNDALPMKKTKNGDWQARVKPEAGREYQYRHLINGSEWHNDLGAGQYAIHPYGGENSVVGGCYLIGAWGLTSLHRSMLSSLFHPGW